MAAYAKSMVVSTLLDLSADLLRRLRAIGFSQTVLAWFRSYLVGRTKVVKTREVTSATVIIQHGVPHGSVLGLLQWHRQRGTRGQWPPNPDFLGWWGTEDQ